MYSSCYESHEDFQGEDLGILNVTWKEGHENRIPEISIIQERMTEIASKLEILLDMSDYE